MRIGLAGVGRIGGLHAGTLAQLPAVDSPVLADADPARAREVADRLGVEAVGSVDALFSAGIDGLAVAAATDAHAPLLLRALGAGLPVFCEKPVAADIDGTLAVLAASEGSRPGVQVGFQRRFDAGYVAARAAVASGSLGWVHTMRAGTLDAAPPPAAFIRTSGGIFTDCSVHDFDMGVAPLE
jgi:myo-inositol 2-dehydrogenase/D-chiro-inositol 1-dehydrogenase